MGKMNDEEFRKSRTADDFMLFCEGDIEPTLNKEIITLIMKTEDFIVYLDKDLFVEWSVNNKYPKYHEDFDSVMNRMAHLETLSMTLLTGSHLEPFRMLLGESVARVLDQNGEEANCILDEAEKYQRLRSSEAARKWYFTSSFFTAAMCTLTAIIIWICRNYIRKHFGINAFDLMFYPLLGSIGSILSVCYRFKSLIIDAAAGKMVYIMEGIVRVVIGVTGALICAVAVKANIIMGFSNELEMSSAYLMAICIVAGVSESFVPNVIKQIESSSINKD